jgi:hypothetical protein
MPAGMRTFKPIIAGLPVWLQHSKQKIIRKISDAVDQIKKNGSDFFKDYNPPTDNKSMKAMLKLYRADVPVKFHSGFLFKCC